MELGGLNLIGSRLLMLSKNSDVCLAGVAGINKQGVRLSKSCLQYSSDGESLESVNRVLIDSADLSECLEVNSLGCSGLIVCMNR